MTFSKIKNLHTILLTLFVVSILYIAFPSRAALLTYVSDSISFHNVNAPANHSIAFITNSGVQAGENIQIAFNSAFNAGAVDYTDIDIEDNGIDLNLGPVASGATWGVSWLGNTLIISSDTAVIPGGHAIEIEIGTNATHQTVGDQQIINPAVKGAYGVVIAGTFADNGNATVYVVDDSTISVSAVVLGSPRAMIQWAVPQLRVGAPETNDDSTFYIAVLTPSDLDDTVLFTQSSLASTTIAGTYSVPISLNGISSSTYDVIIKTDQHVSKKLNDVQIKDGINVLNFSTLNNSTLKGTEVLVAGDINDLGVTPATLGDNEINSVDLSIMLSNLDNDDPTGNMIRANLNQDIVINSVDLSLMIANLDKVGEK